jgi:molecular chaperone Hsp33
MFEVDCVRRFTVEGEALRGEFVRLGPAWLALREYADYPAPVRQLLGEAATAAVLLAATLKFEGELTLQLQGDGPVGLLVAQCTHDFRLRAVARFNRERVHDAQGFRELAGDGRIVVSIESPRMPTYQGIVPLTGDSLAASLEHYFDSSEQLQTAIRLAADEAGTAGLLVQRLPLTAGVGQDPLARLATVRQSMAGMGADELLARKVPDLLQRAVAGVDLRLFDSQDVCFACRCSAERVEGMLKVLGSAECRDLLAERGRIDITCEFCQKPWQFDAVDIERIFATALDRSPGSSAVN